MHSSADRKLKKVVELVWNFFWMEKDHHKKSGSWYTVKVFWLSSALANWAQNTANSSCKVSASALNVTHTFPGVTTSCGFLARWTLASGNRTHLWALPQQEAYKRFMIKARIFLIIKDLSYPSGQTISLTLYISTLLLPGCSSDIWLVNSQFLGEPWLWKYISRVLAAGSKLTEALSEILVFSWASETPGLIPNSRARTSDYSSSGGDRKRERQLKSYWPKDFYAHENRPR